MSLGDIITPAVTSLENVGKFGLVESLLPKEITVGGFVFLIRPHLNDQILSKYIFYVLSSDELINSIKNITKKSGSAFYNINKEAFKNLLFSLPPLQEQQRIVNKLDELFALIDKIEKEQEELEEYKKLAKEKVLELAVTGKLVKQDPNDEPASILLERIKKEKEELIKAGKIKKDKTDSEPLSDDDKNYYQNLPSNWSIVKAKQILKNIQYGFNGAGKASGKYKLLRITDIQNNSVDWNTLPYCDIDFEKSKEFQIEPNDLFIARTGGTIGKSFRLKEAHLNVVFAGYLIRFQLVDCSLTNFVEYFLKSPFYWKQVASKTTGTGQPNINGVSLGNLIIPIPPSNEQKVIINRVKAISQILDN